MSLDPTTLPETEVFPASVQGPLAGSSVLAGDVRTPVQLLGSRTLALQKTQDYVRQRADEATYLALLNETLTDYAAHRANSGGVFHTVADAVNVVSTTTVTTYPEARARTILLIAALVDHFDNTGGAFHSVTDSVGSAALGALATVEDLPTLITALRTVKAQFNLHRERVGVHALDDVVNIVTAAEPKYGTVAGPLDLPVSDVQVFTSSGTWTAPTDFTPQWIEVLLIGGGGGSGSGARYPTGMSTSGGGGGGGGGLTRRRIRASLVGPTEAVVVGTGGAGGTAVMVDATNGNVGGSGLASSFGSLLIAGGGGGGQGGRSGANASGGAGGFGDIYGGDGGDGIDDAAGAAAGRVAGAGGGGGGGGNSNVPTDFAGGAGGLNAGTQGTAAAGGTAGGGAGGTGSASVADNPGHGGGGGGAADAGPGGLGGSGGTFGAGGGGGGSSRNGSTSGAGNDGADGLCIVISLP